MWEIAVTIAPVLFLWPHLLYYSSHSLSPSVNTLNSKPIHGSRLKRKYHNLYRYVPASDSLQPRVVQRDRMKQVGIRVVTRFGTMWHGREKHKSISQGVTMTRVDQASATKQTNDFPRFSHKASIEGHSFPELVKRFPTTSSSCKLTHKNTWHLCECVCVYVWVCKSNTLDSCVGQWIKRSLSWIATDVLDC